MLMPKSNIVAIYEHLFKEGVLVAEKDLFLSKHPELENIPNLHVIKALQEVPMQRRYFRTLTELKHQITLEKSLKSRGYVEENFAWRHYYWRLTNEGIQYLRDYLHLPGEIVPATLKKPTRPEGRPRPIAARAEAQKPEGSRDTYRRAPGASDKAGEAGAGSAPMQFRGGFGRGRPQ